MWSSTTSSTPRIDRAIWAAIVMKPCPTSEVANLSVDDAVGEPAPGGRVVVEALRVHEVLDRHTPADAAHDVAAVGRASGATRQGHEIGRGGRTLGRHRQRGGVTDALFDRRDVQHRLAGDQFVAGLHRVQQADLDRVEPAGVGELVHLRLVGEARLHHAEPAHRSARQVVRAHGVAVDHGVGAPVRALGVGDAVDQHRRRRRRVRAAVEDHPRLDLDDLAGRRGVVAHPHRRRVAVHVPEETLGAAVRDAHRPAEPQRQQARVHLQADVLAAAERSADAAERRAAPRRRAGRGRRRSGDGPRAATAWRRAVRRRRLPGSGMASAASRPRNAWSCIPIS